MRFCKFFLGAVLFFGSTGFAQGFGSAYPTGHFFSGKNVVLKKEFLNNLFAVGNSISFNGSSSQDAVFIGLNVNLNGWMDKDVYVCADDVELSGSVRGNLHVIAREVKINGLSVDGNCEIVAPSVEISAGSVFRKTAKIWGNTVALAGNYDNLLVECQRLFFPQKVFIKKDLLVKMNLKPVLPGNVTVKGRYRYEKFLPTALEKAFSFKYRKIFSFLSLCVPFVLMVFFMPNFFNDTVEVIDTHPFKTFLVGFFGLVTFPVILFVLMLTIIGAPLGLITLIYYFSLIYFSRGFSAAGLGKKIFRKMPECRTKYTLAIIAGIGIFVFLTSIPKVSYFFQAVFIIFGFGGLISGRLKTFRRLRKAKIL